MMQLMSLPLSEPVPTNHEATGELSDQVNKSQRKQDPGRDAITNLLKFLLSEFRKTREIAEQAVNQMPAQDLTWRPSVRGNSVSMLMRHLGGNLHSRFTDFLTTDGEKPERNRDSEFLNDVNDKETTLTKWKIGWERLEKTLDMIGHADVNRIVTIRGEPYTVLQALLRAMTHTSYHVGQIVDIARERAPKWKTLSMPRSAAK
jgi:hypothetical protein